jgi:hypothetical protein
LAAARCLCKVVCASRMRSSFREPDDPRGGLDPFF